MNETTVPTDSLPALLGKPQPFVIDQPDQVLALPPGWKPERLKQDEKHLDAPRRTVRTVTAWELSGLIGYVNRFKTDQSALYCTSDKAPSVTARIDDHQKDRPAHAGHLCEFPCPVTEEWSRWTGASGKQMNHQQFAEFMEDNLRDIVEPSGASFMTAITNLTVQRNVEFKSGTRLSDGQVQFAYIESDGTQGQAVVPQKITVGLPIFMGVPKRYAIDARVKYRLDKEGKLVLWFELDRPDLSRAAAYAELLAAITEQTGLPIHKAI